MSYELELFFLAVFLYLFDSAPLIYSNEFVLECDSRGKWTAAQGKFMLAGRLLCLLNPFTPHRPAFRLQWHLAKLDDNDANPYWSISGKELQALAPAVLTAGVGLFCVLPVGMFTAAGAYVIIPALLIIYGATVLALFRVYRLRDHLAISRRCFIAIAFECLACPPFAVNLVRKITLARTITEPLPSAARRLLSDADWRSLQILCLSMLNDAIEIADDLSERQLLEVQKSRLIAPNDPV